MNKNKYIVMMFLLTSALIFGACRTKHSITAVDTNNDSLQITKGGSLSATSSELTKRFLDVIIDSISIENLTPECYEVLNPNVFTGISGVPNIQYDGNINSMAYQTHPPAGNRLRMKIQGIHIKSADSTKVSASYSTADSIDISRKASSVSNLTKEVAVPASKESKILIAILLVLLGVLIAVAVYLFITKKIISRG